MTPKKKAGEKYERAAITPKESMLAGLNPYEVRNTGTTPSCRSTAPPTSMDSNETDDAARPMLERNE